MISNKCNTEGDFWGVIVIFCQFLVRGSGSGILLYKANLNLVAQSTEILLHRASNPADPLSVWRLKSAVNPIPLSRASNPADPKSAVNPIPLSHRASNPADPESVVAARNSEKKIIQTWIQTATKKKKSKKMTLTKDFSY